MINSALLIINDDNYDDKTKKLIKLFRSRRFLVILVSQINNNLGYDAEPSDIILVKTCNSAFENTQLKSKLNKSNIKNLYICTDMFDISINETVKDANNQGYNCEIISDCTNISDDYKIITFDELENNITNLGTDSKMYFNFLCDDDLKKLNLNVPSLLTSINWNTMNHNGNAVPRLISIQYKPNNENMEPIYRHPVDKMPKQIPYQDFVAELSNILSKSFGIEFNHVLIQYYRNGNDFIGEHCDKTLDIVPNTPIINYTIGATRFLRITPKSKSGENQFIGLESNSLLSFGLKTNEKYFHEIRQDKRPVTVKNSDELIDERQRISFTFRSIGTYLKDGKLLGQGSPKKSFSEDDSEKMLTAFGEENRSSEFDWEKWYGDGFHSIDLNMKNT